MRTDQRRSITVRAPGKINVYFRVGALQDDGYHEVASLYQAVSLFEEVTATECDTFKLRFGGPIDTSGLSTDDTNLAIRAAKLLAAHTGYGGGVDLTVLKRVPIAGGMGGGSADAAATLLACDELWGTGLGRAGLVTLAAELGADVPFALEGGTAVGTGRGDELSPALAKGTFHWVLALSAGGLSTPEVYSMLDRHRDDHRSELGQQPEYVKVETAVLQAVRVGDAESLADSMHNDLQAAALRLAPELTQLLELGESRGALAGIVSGSGPTVAFLVASAQEASELKSVLSRAGVSALTVTGPVHGARIIEG
ncbi:4-(cytidine 5'-diphospho)-2-C-methyl-D-erythritol kinase [Leucobacter albus]|uniref:4-diphosphocytidyl-2-C-methyl-D-erythritol kinase n=1 Tax=Leucobacter albus TaxID=272210 RepID=A0ABW3TTA5_9MICO